MDNSGLQAPYVFVLLPFKPEFFAIYEVAIKPPLQELGCIVEHASEVNTVDRILDTIFTEIARARFLVADTTGKNPNVLYELGYAHALGKRVILLVQDSSDLPFDVHGLKHLVYKPDRRNALAEEIKKLASFVLDQ